VSPSNTFHGLHARHYDVIYSDKPYADEARFVHHLLGGSSGRLLDVACGSGRHALEFARLGWSVTGADYSPDLLSRASANAARAGVTLDLHEQDMRELSMPGVTFDAVTCLFDSIGYPQSNEGVVAALSRMRAHLAPGGRVAVEFLHAPAMLAHAAPVKVRRFELPEGGTLLRVSETEVDEAELVMHVDYEVVALRPDGTYERGRERQSNRFFGLEEMRALMELAGLRVARLVAAYAPQDVPIDAGVFHVIALAEPA
jgi:SAM-dependent methyltransferase